MKILLTVEFYEPRKGGAEEVIKQIAEKFVKSGHDVYVATSFLPNRSNKIINGVKIKQFKISGNLVRGINGDKRKIEKYKKFLENNNFNLIFNYASQSWTTDLMFSILDKISSKKILAPVGYSNLNNPKYKEYFKKLPEYLKKYDTLIYHSKNYQDYIFGEKNNLNDKAIIISNGASYEEFVNENFFDIKKKLKIKTKYLIISVSNHYRAKGHHFVISSFKKMNRNDASLLIIGNKKVSYGWHRWAHFILDYLWCWLSSKINKNILLSNGDNRNFVISAYKQADLFLFGSQVECAPLVMYESFASKTPFVSTPVGNVSDYKDIVKIVYNENEMAKISNYLLDHDSERLHVAEEAFQAWKKNYTWDKISSKYENILSKHNPITKNSLKKSTIEK